MRKLPPWSMTLGRVLFAPALLWMVLRGIRGWPVAACIVAEVVVDIFDGMVARRLGVATSLLRRIDSIVDTIFFLAVLYCAWALHADALRRRAGLLIGLIALEALRYGFDFLKFRREAAYHMWSSKLWGLFLGASVIALLAYNVSGWLLTTALLLGILCDLEGLLVSILLYENVEDVPHIFRAIELRRSQRANRTMRQLATTSSS